MIAMLSETDCKGVGYEFRKLASSEIIGLTTYSTGEKQKRRIHSRILWNMDNTRLKNTLHPLSSEVLVNKLRKERSSLEKRGLKHPKP